MKICFLAPNGDRLFYKNIQTGKQDFTWGLGTSDKGEYILRVEGENGGGLYHFQLEEYQ